MQISDIRINLFSKVCCIYNIIYLITKIISFYNLPLAILVNNNKNTTLAPIFTHKPKGKNKAHASLVVTQMSKIMYILFRLVRGVSSIQSLKYGLCSQGVGVGCTRLFCSKFKDFGAGIASI